MTENASRGLLLRMLVVGIGAFLLSVLLDPPHSPEHWSSDLVTARFSQPAKAQDPNIALVYISEATLADKPYLSPIDRGVLANLVSAIDQAGAKVIALDLILDRKTEAEKDSKLIDTIKRARAKVVLGVVEGPAQFQSDILRELGLGTECGELNPGSRITCGHIYFGEHHNTLLVSDYVVRFIEETPALKSFGSTVAAAWGKTYPAGSRTISWLLPPQDGSENFLTLDGRGLLDEHLAPDLRRLMDGRIVLIGGNFKDRDSHLIPLSIANGERYPGLFIHAQFIAQLLDRRDVKEVTPPVAVLILFPIVLSAYYLGKRSGHRHLWLELGGVVFLIILTIMLFVFGHFLFPLAYAALVWLVGGAVGHYGNPIERAPR